MKECRRGVSIYLLAFFCAISGNSTSFAQSSVLNSPKMKAAQAFIDSDHERSVRETILLTEIEAPPFKEASRARVFAQMMRESGLANVEIDAEGNVLGLRKGVGNGPLIAVAAHLDTVFPSGTDVKVKRNGTKLMAPGVADDSRGLAVLLSIVRAMAAAKIETNSDILFVADVGEEGPGDLRGVTYLFQKGAYKDRIRMFMSIDGAGLGSDITTGALGSKRYRATFRGPGGHSYGSFGIVNPAYAMAKAIEMLTRADVPNTPRTTFNVGTIGGGTSVNSIPFEVWMEVDLRSESPQELSKLSDTFVSMMKSAAAEENRTRSTAEGAISVEVKLMGDRPTGETPRDSAIVQAATTTMRAFGLQPRYYVSSTDSNIPMSMGIPAITLDTGTNGGRAHTIDEWIDVEKITSVRGVNIVMGTLLSLAGVR